jgi:hypothetical protein
LVKYQVEGSPNLARRKTTKKSFAADRFHSGGIEAIGAGPRALDQQLVADMEADLLGS